MSESIQNPRIRLVATPDEKAPPSANGSDADAPPPATDKDNPYLGDFSRRLAERLAGLPKPTGLSGLESEDEFRLSWSLFRRSYKFGLVVMVGAVLYGGIMYALLKELRSTGPLAGAIATSTVMRR